MNGPQIATAACCPIRGVAVVFFFSVCRFALVALCPRQNNINDNANEIKLIIGLLTFLVVGKLVQVQRRRGVTELCDASEVFSAAVTVSSLSLSVPPSVCRARPCRSQTCGLS